MRSRNASGTPAADDAPAARRFHPVWGVRLAVPLCGAVVALVLAPLAGASCPSLRDVRAFTGHVTEHVGAQATGLSCPDCGGSTVGIQLGHAMHKVHFHLGNKHHDSFVYDFKGGASGGMVAVDDGYEDTGADFSGELKYHAPVPKKHGGGEGLILINHKTCDYAFKATVAVLATYKGDAEINPGRDAGTSGATKVKHLPHDLILSGSDTVPTYPSCSELGRLDDCAEVESGWTQHLVTLQQCGFLLPPSGDNCVDDMNPQLKTPASFSWHLHPVFDKHHKT